MNLFNLLLYTAGAIGMILLWVWSLYNSCVKQKNQVLADASDIDIQLKRRSSLVNNLIELVREYAKHEEETFENVAKARSGLETSQTASQKAQAEHDLEGSLRSLFLVVENYPKLQASENYQELRVSLTETENHIAIYREEYNRSVMRYNTFIQIFPNLLITTLLGFKEEELFQINQTV